MNVIDPTFRASTPTCLAIGNFDGVHRGHTTLLARAKERAAALGVIPSVLTFEPHPAAVLGRVAPARLTSLSRKYALLRALGFENVFALGFDLPLAQTSAPEFAHDILFERLRARAIVVGETFRFGQGRAGNVAVLESLAAPHGIEISAIPLLSENGEVLSSSRVRAALAAGDVEGARGLLGRPHRITGVVAHGDARGRTIGFPTANLSATQEMAPKYGVYAVDVLRENRVLGRGAMNIGVRPTVTGSNDPRLEVNVLDFAGDLYGQELSVDFVGHIRGEQTFESLDALKAQITRDVERARTF